MPCAIVILYPMCHGITERNKNIVHAQVELFNGEGHQWQEHAMVCACQRDAVNKRSVDLVMRNGRGCERWLIIDKSKEFGIRERFWRRKKHPLTATESWKCVNHKSNARF